MKLILALFMLSTVALHLETSAAAGPYWVSISLSKIPLQNNVPASVIIHATRYADQPTAEAQALANCRADYPNGGGNCHILESFNSGCLYETKGTVGWGEAGYGLGFTPQAAYDNCYAQGLNCETSVGGGCANPAEDVPKDQVKAGPHWPTWVEIAIGMRTEPGTLKRYLSLANFLGPNQTTARAAAIAQCQQKEPRAGACWIKSEFNSGCQFWSPGKNNALNTVNAWSGSSALEALQNCQRAGYECPPGAIIGACAL